jgi:uncharacterized protein YkwD
VDAKVRAGIFAGIGVGGLVFVPLTVAVVMLAIRKDNTREPHPTTKATAPQPALPIPVPDSAKQLAQNDEPEPDSPTKSYPIRPELPDASGLLPETGSRPVVDSTESLPRRVDVPATSPVDDKPEVASKPIKLSAIDQAYLNRLNAFRALAGQRPVTIDPEISRGCAAHAHYLVMHYGQPTTAGMGVHNEIAGAPGYTKAGEIAARRSVITEYGANLPGLPDRSWPATALDLWMSTLYHRVPILSPALSRIGIGYARNDTATAWYVVMDVGSGHDSEAAETRQSVKAVVYPGDGQTDVPRRFGWGTPELPNPLPVGHKPDNSGYPITVSFPRGVNVTDVQATLRREPEENESSAKPEEIPFWLSTPDQPASSADQQNSVCIIAAKRLKEHTTYQVSARATVDGNKWQKKWKFTTGHMK